MDKNKRIADEAIACACCQSRSFEISTGLIQCCWCGAAYTIPDMDNLKIHLIRDTLPPPLLKTDYGYQCVQQGYIFSINLRDKSVCMKFADYDKAPEAFESLSKLINNVKAEAK